MQLNYTAPINYLGYGVVGLNTLQALMEGGHEVAWWPIGSTDPVYFNNYEFITKAFLNQAFYNGRAPSIRHYHQFDLAQHVGKGPHIGSTVFELNSFSQRELNHLNQQDGVCTATKWGAEVLEERGVRRPIGITPHGVDRNIFNENLGVVRPAQFKNDTIFLNIGKWEIRKGHDVLVEAFNRAFTPDDAVQLVMLCQNPFYSDSENGEWNNLYESSPLGLAGKVHVVKGRFESQQEVAKLMAASDCGVFPARAEGWGLESFEMMAVGKWVILTDYSGHTEYATPDNSLLISPGPLENAYDGKWFLGDGGEWASMEEDQIEQIVAAMRKVHCMKQSGHLSVNLNGIETTKRLSWVHSAQALVDFVTAPWCSG
jgi:glycosyltransferase involved in cell wall biosynthesis